MNNQRKGVNRRQPKELNIQIGERCRRARERSGYTQEQLAERISVSTQFLSDAERGVTGMSVSTIIRLCDVLSISTDFLLMGRDDSAGPENALSAFSRIQKLSPKQQKIMEEIINLVIQSFHLST